MDKADGTQPWQDLHGYWVARHVSGRPPSRADIDPMIDLRQLAPNLFIVDLHPSGYEYRLIGSDIVERAGMDYTGKAVGTSGMDPRVVAEWARAIDLVVSTGKPTLLAFRRRSEVKARNIVIMLPLAPDAAGLAKILGGSFYDGLDIGTIDCAALGFTELLIAL